MLASRGYGLLRALRQAAKINRSQNSQQVRNSGHGAVYRLPAPPSPPSVVWAAEIVGGVGWWWILWHFWHEHEHVTGEFDYPDPSKWTDEELGIPPDDQDS